MIGWNGYISYRGKKLLNCSFAAAEKEMFILVSEDPYFECFVTKVLIAMINVSSQNRINNTRMAINKTGT